MSARAAFSPAKIQISEETIKTIFDNEAKKLNLKTTSMKVARVVTSNSKLLNGKYLNFYATFLWFVFD